MTSVTRTRLAVLAAVTLLTVAIHYGWVLQPLFGHVSWVHAIHGRFCYIPIMMAAAWFGLRGGLVTASVISILVLPIVARSFANSHNLAGEIAEIVFYYLIGILIGALVDRENTARRRTQQAQRIVERSQKLSLAGQIAAGVAHEIKNPLASIKGAADILTETGTASDVRDEFRDILHAEVQRIDATVDEFLEFARPRAAELQRMNLSECVSRAVRQFEGQARQKGVNLAVDIQDDVIILGDAEKFHQMTLNLLLNALQASEDSKEIDVAVGVDRAGTYLAVADRGTGMTSEQREHVFEPFFTTRSSGTGLGLAMVKGIVDEHAGDISIDSRAGEGTRVRVTLPVASGGPA